jgi:hypothetical protein
MMKDSSDNPNEFSKKTDDLNERVHNYSLFNKGTGAKIELTAGMPFKTADGGFGYAGNWGVWAENQDLIVDGASITSEGSTPVPYTVVAKGGKLVKHSKISKTLEDIDGLPLSLWTCGDNGCSEKVVKWNSANSEFQHTANRVQDQDTGMFIETPITPVALTTENTSNWDSGWAETLSTSIQVGHYVYAGSLTDATVLTYHVETTVQPGDDEVPTTLYTESWVPDFSAANLTADALRIQEQFWYGNSYGGKNHQVTFDPSNYSLHDGIDTSAASSIVVPATLDLVNSGIYGFHVWGLMESQNLDPNDATTYYSWQTGQDSWNKFTSIRDSEGEMVEFDQAISMSYTHLTANDRNDDSSKNNMLYQINYDGSNLGIPWVYDATTLDWNPEFNLKDGITLSDGTTDYVVKASDISKSMIMLSTGGDGQPEYVSGLTVDETTSDPTLEYDATVIDAMPDQPKLGSDGNAIQVKVSKGVKVE